MFRSGLAALLFASVSANAWAGAPAVGAAIATGLVAHREMIVAIRDKVAPLVSQGKSLEDVVASKPTAAFDSKVPMPGTTG